MAYNLQPLITILEQILNPEQTRCILDNHNKTQLQSPFQESASLQTILEKSLLPKIDSLEIQIREAAQEAEDMIESHMVGEMLSSPEGVNLEFIAPDLQHVMQELDSAMEQVVNLVEVEGKKMPSGSSESGGASSFHDPSSKSSVVVGVDEDLEQLKDRLTGTKSKLEIVPIVGMGGIGKTTIARKLYQDSSIISHFQYARAWASISQDYDLKAILSSLLRCIIGKEFDDEKHSEKDSDE